MTYFEWCLIAIIGMRSDMVIPDVCKFFYCLIKFLIIVIVVKIDQLVFQRIILSFHWRIIVRTPGSAHALGDSNGFTIINKVF